MYIDKFKAWGITKQYQAADARRLAAQIAEAAFSGTPVSEVMFRGRPVDAKKVLRHMLRSGKPNEDTSRLRVPQSTGISEAPGTTILPSTTCDLSTLGEMPEPAVVKDQRSAVYEAALDLNEVEAVDDLADPWFQQTLKSSADMGHLDAVLSHVHAYFESTSFASILKPVDQLDYSFDPVDRSRDPNGQFFDTIKLAVYFLRADAIHQAWPLLNAACEEIMYFPFEPDPFFLADLLMVFSPATFRDHPEVRKSLLSYVGAFCAQSLGITHPFTVICRRLAQSSSTSSELAVRALQFMLDAASMAFRDYRGLIAKMHRALAALVRRDLDLEHAQQLAIESLKYSRSNFGDCHFFTEQAIMELVYVYRCQAEYDKGIQLCAEALHSKEVRLGYEFPDSRGRHAMEYMAELHQLKGNIDEAIHWFNKALFSAWCIEGAVPSTILVRDELERVLISDGRYDEAKKMMLRYFIVDNDDILLPM